MLPTHGFTAQRSPCSNQLPLQSLSSHCGRRSPIRCCTFHKSCCCCGQTALRLLRSTRGDFNPAEREPTGLLLYSLRRRLHPSPSHWQSLLPPARDHAGEEGLYSRQDPRPLSGGLALRSSTPATAYYPPSCPREANSGHTAARQLSAPPLLPLLPCWQPLPAWLLTNNQLYNISSTQAAPTPHANPGPAKCPCPNSENVHKARQGFAGPQLFSMFPIWVGHRHTISLHFLYIGGSKFT